MAIIDITSIILVLSGFLGLVIRAPKAQRILLKTCAILAVSWGLMFAVSVIGVIVSD